MSAGIPWASLLTFLLAVLKLTGNISISWWWVAAPFWLPFLTVAVISVGVFMVLTLVTVVAALVGGMSGRRN